MINLILVLSSGIMIGVIYQIIIVNIIKNNKNSRKIKQSNEVFNQIYDNIIVGDSKFKTRVVDSVYLTTKLPDYGKVDILYTLDTENISILKNNELILDSSLVDVKILDKLCYTIRYLYDKEIHDVVSIFGISISKSDFEKIFTVVSLDNSIKPLEKKTKEIILDIDVILDRINELGGEEFLTDIEKEFLKNYKL